MCEYLVYEHYPNVIFLLLTLPLQKGLRVRAFRLPIKMSCSWTPHKMVLPCIAQLTTFKREHIISYRYLHHPSHIRFDICLFEIQIQKSKIIYQSTEIFQGMSVYDN